MVSVVLGCWLAFVVAEPVPMHACSMHDGTLAAATTHDGHHAGHGAASHATHEPAAPQPDTEHAGCLCLGDCCAATAAALPTAPLEVATVGAARSASARGSPPHAVPPADAQLRLHWANAPPTNA